MLVLVPFCYSLIQPGWHLDQQTILVNFYVMLCWLWRHPGKIYAVLVTNIWPCCSDMHKLIECLTQLR